VGNISHGAAAPNVAKLGSAPSALAPSALPSDYLERMRQKSLPSSTVHMQQDAAYEESRLADLVKEEEDEVIAETLREAEELEQLEQERQKMEEERLKSDRAARRAEFASARDGEFVLRFTLPSGMTLRQSFVASDAVRGRVAEFILLQEEVVGVKWKAVALPDKHLICCDETGTITFALDAPVRELGRVAIRILIEE
jgi:hypothetical protein